MTPKPPPDNGARLEHRLKLTGLGEVLVRVYPRTDTVEDAVVIIAGQPSDGCLVRLQSACFYGETLGSRDCDCGPQLHQAMERIRDEGAGVVIHLNQEGRGLGLKIKAAAYVLSELEGLNSFEAYDALGVPRDPRDYGAAVQALTDLGIRHIRLMTNNPHKISSLAKSGLRIERIPLIAAPDPTRAAYIEGKRSAGHLL